MALLKTTDIDGGITVNDAYHKIEKIELKVEYRLALDVSQDGQSIETNSDDLSSFEVMVVTYKDEAYRNQEEFLPVTIKTLVFEVPFSALNNLTTSDQNSIRTKVYEYLKTLPEYDGATDA